MAKLYNQNGDIIGNFACIHFYQHGFGSDLTREIKPYQKVLLEFFKDQQQEYLAKCLKCSEWGTVCGIYDGPFNSGNAKLLAVGASIVSLDDCNCFSKKKGLFIAMSRACFSINKKCIKKLLVINNKKETRYLMVPR